MRRCAVLFLMVLLPALAVPVESEFTWRKAGPGYVWEFPRDYHLHPDFKTEWWYITGHLFPEESPDTEPFGYQLTFFRSGLAPADSLAAESAWQPTIGGKQVKFEILRDPDNKSRRRVAFVKS